MSADHPQAPRPRLVVLAGMVVDLVAGVSLPVLPSHNQDARPMHFEAGASANVIIVAARLGLDVSVVGALGDDPPGSFLLRILADEHVDGSAVEVIPGAQSPLTLSLIDHDRHEHVFIGNVGQGRPADYTAATRARIDAADALFWHGYTLHETQIAPLLKPVLTRCRERGIPIFFDSGPTLRPISPERIAWSVAQATYLKMTEGEVPLAAGGRTGQAAFDYFFGLGVRMVIVTQGSEGCTVVTPTHSERVPGFAVPVVDTVGAGDTFSAAFLYGMLNGKGGAASARLGNAAGAIAVQKIGAGRNLPVRAEVEQLLKDAGESIL